MNSAHGRVYNVSFGDHKNACFWSFRMEEGAIERSFSGASLFYSPKVCGDSSRYVSIYASRAEGTMLILCEIGQNLF